jgi:phage terminase large subunit-like protein
MNENPIIAYWEEIESGRIKACKKITRQYRHLAHEVENGAGGYHYSAKRAQHAIDFIQKFCHNSKGKKFGGKLIELMMWEKAMIAAIFGFIDDDGNRRCARAVLIVGKKNGKSLLASAIGLYMQIADGEPGAEVYAVATKKDQAKIIWAEARRMVRKSPELADKIKTLVAEMVSDFNDSIFKPLASDSDTLDGLNISCALMDEIHQWRSGKALYDIIADGTIGRDQPLILITSTAGTVREDIYDQVYDECEQIINGYEDENGYHDETTLCFIYELDAREEWQDPACWIKANPGLGVIKPLETLRRKVERAIANPSEVRNLVCKEFNIRETDSQAWLSFEEIDNRETFDVKALAPRYGCGGVDLSATTDLTSAKVIFRMPNDPNLYVFGMYWIPEDLVQQRVIEDHVPYDKWIEQGHVRTCPGRRISYKMVHQWFLDVQAELGIYLLYVGYDSWSAAYFVEEMQASFGTKSVLPVIQGKKTLSAPMQALGAEFAARTVIYNNNPVDKWCFCNTAIEEDKNGNIQPHKTSRPTKRIDGLAALLDAYVVLCDHEGEYLDMIR